MDSRNTTAGGCTRGRRWTLTRSLAIALGIGLGIGCAPASAQSLRDLLKKVTPPAPAPAPAPPPAVAPEAAQVAPSRSGFAPLATRPLDALRALCERGTVNGQELVAELVAIRAMNASQRSAQVMQTLLGSTDTPGGGGFDPKAELFKLGLKAAEEQMKPYVASIGFGALDLHLKSLVEDPQLLAAEQVRLPSPANLTAEQLQRVVNMAALVVATRATGKVLLKAQQDFAGVEDDYTRLIERREAVARLLYDVLIQAGHAAPADLQGLYNDDDLRYLRDSVSRGVSEFANDLGAQNLALRWLRLRDPSAWADYQSRSDGLRAATKGYLRSTAGVTAFAALLANFGQQSMSVLRRKNASDILIAMPFAAEFVKEVPPLLKLSWQVGAAGVVELPMRANKRFRVIDAAGAEDLASARDAFAALSKRGAEPLLEESLFRSGTDGLLYKLYRCDRSEVGRMLDTAVPVAEREKFSARALGTEEARFSFQNAFNAPPERARERELGDELLRSDHRQSAPGAAGVAMGELQRLAARGYARWNNDQLLRLILANREGAAAHATLQLGEVRVRPVPSMQSVFAFEALIDECSQQFGGAARRP